MEENKIEFFSENDKKEDSEEESSVSGAVNQKKIKALVFSGNISILLLVILWRMYARAIDHFSWLKNRTIKEANEAMAGIHRINIMLGLYILIIVALFLALYWFFCKEIKNKKSRAFIIIPILLILGYVFYLVFEGTIEFGGGYGLGPGASATIISWVVLFPTFIVYFISMLKIRNNLDKVDKIICVLMILSPLAIPLLGTIIGGLVLAII